MEPIRDPYLNQQSCRTAERHGRHQPRLNHPTVVRPERARNPTRPFPYLDGSRRVIRHQNAARDDDIQPSDPVDGHWDCVSQHRGHGGLGKTRRDVQPPPAASYRHHPARTPIDLKVRSSKSAAEVSESSRQQYLPHSPLPSASANSWAWSPNLRSLSRRELQSAARRRSLPPMPSPMPMTRMWPTPSLA